MTEEKKPVNEMQIHETSRSRSVSEDSFSESEDDSETYIKCGNTLVIAGKGNNILCLGDVNESMTMNFTIGETGNSMTINGMPAKEYAKSHRNDRLKGTDNQVAPNSFSVARSPATLFNQPGGNKGSQSAQNGNQDQPEPKNSGKCMIL